MKAMNTLSSLSRFAVAAGASLKPFAACLLVLGALAVVTGGCATHPPLHGAIVRKDNARAKALIERGRDLERRDSFGATPLHRAAEAGNTNLVSALLERGVAIDAFAKDGATPLIYSCGAGQLPTLELLVQRGADAGHRIRSGSDCLFNAAVKGRNEVVAWVLARGADVNARTLAGYTALYAAAESGHAETVRLLLHAGADPALGGENGLNPLNAAVWNGHVPVARVLLAHGTPVNELSRERYPRADWHNAGCHKLAAEHWEEAGDPNAAGMHYLRAAEGYERAAELLNGEARQQGNALAGAFVADLGIHFLAALAGGHAYTDVPYSQMVRDRRETRALAERATQNAAVCRAKAAVLTEASLARH